MEIYLYGAGRNGKNILTHILNNQHLGNVIGFIDSNPKRANDTLCGLPIYIPDDMPKRLNKNAVILLTPDLVVSLRIADTLKEKHIYRYLYWDYLEEYGIDKKLQSLTGMDDSVIFNESLIFENRVLKYQVNYFMDHIDAASIKKATGEEREHQLNLVKLTADLLKMAHPLNVEFILFGGNLLGYYRHNGFIPWDDDMDLVLTEHDYNIFLEYCKENIPYYEYDGKYNNEMISSWYKEMAALHQNQIIILSTPLLLRIYRDEIFIDVFPIRCYKSEANRAEHDKFCKNFSQSLLKCETCAEQKQLVEKILDLDMEYSDEKGDNWFYSPHSVEAYFGSKRNWFKQEIFFPLKKVFFEGVEISVPNDIASYLTIEYGENYMSLPSDLGLYCHQQIVDKL